MTIPRTPDGEPPTGPVAAITDPTEPTAGDLLLAELADDEPAIEPSDKPLHALGCLVSALALHIPDGQWTSVALLSPPGEYGAQIEVRCATTSAAAAVITALPWPAPPITRPETGDHSVHHVTRGVLWGFRIAVVGLEPIGGSQ